MAFSVLVLNIVCCRYEKTISTSVKTHLEIVLRSCLILTEYLQLVIHQINCPVTVSTQNVFIARCNIHRHHTDSMVLPFLRQSELLHIESPQQA